MYALLVDKMDKEIKIMNYCKGVKNIQFPLQPKTILIPSMVPSIRLKGTTLTLSLPFCVLLPFGKRVRESVFPWMVSRGFGVSIQGNALSLTYFQKKEGRKKGNERVSVLPCRGI